MTFRVNKQLQLFPIILQISLCNDHYFVNNAIEQLLEYESNWEFLILVFDIPDWKEFNFFSLFNFLYLSLNLIEKRNSKHSNGILCKMYHTIS